MIVVESNGRIAGRDSRQGGQGGPAQNAFEIEACHFYEKLLLVKWRNLIVFGR